jgi:hypothetical protein
MDPDAPSAGVVIGIIIGVLVPIIVLVVASRIWYSRRQRRAQLDMRMISIAYQQASKMHSPPYRAQIIKTIA